MQKEQGYKESFTIDNKEVTKSILERLRDGEVKEMLIKRLEEEEKEFAEKLAIAKGITD